MATKTHVPPTLKPSSRAELDRKRKGVLGTGPSGAVYRIRKLNLTRHLEAGGLSSELTREALRGITMGQDGQPQIDFDPETLSKMAEAREETRDYQDRLVLATVVEPALTQADLGTGELDDDPVLPAVDYDWLLSVAQGRAHQGADGIQRDAEGKSLWGPEPKSRYEVFRRHHDCAEDCADCDGVIEEFMAQVAA